MSSTIVWILTIFLNSGLSAEGVRIQFNTEAECEAARTHILSGQKRAECNPAKLDKALESSAKPVKATK